MKIFSIFSSINGEVCNNGIGSPTTFVRFAGCTADCPYCDTTYANSADQATDMKVPQIMQRIKELGCNNITITGGEPLEQPMGLARLVDCLIHEGYSVSIETNGLHRFDRREDKLRHATWVVDIKNHVPFEPYHYQHMNLRKVDFIKMVVGSLDQFLVAWKRKQILQTIGVMATFAFSPEYGRVTPDQLLNWMRIHKITDVHLNFQAHKILSLTEAK